MNRLLAPVSGLLVATSILLTGHGLQALLIPIRADIADFPDLVIGLLASAYFAGLMAGCYAGPRLIARVGHARAFAAFTAIGTTVPLAHAIYVEPGFWLVLRFILGACIAGFNMVIESWLNGSATNETRGRVLASYTIVNLVVVVIGQQMINLGDPAGFELFSLVAVLISLAAVPMALTRASAPAVPRAARLRVRWLYTASPVAVAGCFVTGLAGGAFWGLGPVFARAGELSLPEVAVLMSAVPLGGALAQWPLGRWSDFADRRIVIAVASVGAVLAGIGLAAAHGNPAPWLFGFAAFYGTTAFCIYAVCLAHANDLVSREESVDVSSGLLLVYAAGAIAGPFLAALIMALTSPALLFAFTAGCHGLLFAFTLHRMRRRAAVPPEAREEFVAVPRTSPALFELDPRTQTVVPATSAEDGES